MHKYMLKDTQLEGISAEKVAIKLNMKQQGPLQKRRPILPWGTWGKILVQVHGLSPLLSTSSVVYGMLQYKRHGHTGHTLAKGHEDAEGSGVSCLWWKAKEAVAAVQGLFSLEKRKLKKILSMYVNT